MENSSSNIGPWENAAMLVFDKLSAHDKRFDRVDNTLDKISDKIDAHHSENRDYLTTEVTKLHGRIDTQNIDLLKKMQDHAKSTDKKVDDNGDKIKEVATKFKIYAGIAIFLLITSIGVGVTYLNNSLAAKITSEKTVEQPKVDKESVKSSSK